MTCRLSKAVCVDFLLFRYIVLHMLWL